MTALSPEWRMLQHVRMAAILRKPLIAVKSLEASLMACKDLFFQSVLKRQSLGYT